MSSFDPDAAAQQKLDYARIRQIGGTVEPWQVSAILALDATVGEMEEAVAWVTVEADHSGLHHAADGSAARDGRVAAIYEILKACRDDTDDET